MAGNKNSGRRQEKPFADALRMEIAALKDDRKGLRRVARKLIQKAEEGDLAAIKELADRVDGKAMQRNVNENTHQFQDPLNELLSSIAANGTDILGRSENNVASRPRR